MEGMTAAAFKSTKGYWKRRGYQRLNGWKNRRRMPTVQLGSAAEEEENRKFPPPPQRQRRRRFWRIRRVKLKMSYFSPKRFLIGLRDAYVNFMNRLAGSRYISSGMAGGYGGGGMGFGARPIKEYDEKMIIQIYKSLVLAQQSHLVGPAGVAPPRRIEPLHPHPHPHPPPLATIAEC